MKQEQHGGELQWIIRKYVDSLIQKMLESKLFDIEKYKS